jgi:hypothetical protein
VLRGEGPVFYPPNMKLDRYQWPRPLKLAGVLAPLQVPKMPLAEPPPRDSRFGSPLKLSKVHWVRPEVVVEVTYHMDSYLTWADFH